jgi:hypothetical protein
VASTAAGAGAAFTAEVEAAVSMAGAGVVVFMAGAAEGFTPVAVDIVGAAPTAARVHLAAARDLLAEGVTTRAEAIVVDRQDVGTELAGARTAASVPHAA